MLNLRNEDVRKDTIAKCSRGRNGTMPQSVQGTNGPTRAMRLYLLAWTTLAAVAVLYLAALAYESKHAQLDGARSLDTANRTDGVSQISGALGQTRKDVASLRSEISQLAKQVDATGAEIGEIKSQVAANAKRSDDMAAGLAALADAPKPQIATDVAATGDTGSASVATDGTSTIVGTTVEPAGSDPNSRDLSSRDISLILQEAASATGPMPDVPLPGRRSYGVEIAEGPSVEAIRLFWDLLNERHGALLGGLSSRYRAKDPASGNPYSLIAGPLPNSNAAEQLCVQLNQLNLSCRPTGFQGELL